MFQNFFKKKQPRKVHNTNKYSLVVLYVPDRILHRTDLICKYIERATSRKFGLDNFLMSLYENFIMNTVLEYNTSEIINIISKKPQNRENFKIIVGNEIQYLQQSITYTKITLKMLNKDINTGNLLIKELEETNNFSIEFGELFSNLWINFIDGYRDKENKDMYKIILNMINENARIISNELEQDYLSNIEQA